MTKQLARRAAAAVLAAAAPAAAVIANADASPAAHSAGALHGTLALSPGKYKNGKAGGSFFRMLYPSSSSKYFQNPDSKARDKSYTLISPGSAGGIVLGTYQPSSAFDGSGNSKAGAIIKPTAFAGIRFGLATLRKDPQSKRSNPAPALTVSGRKISGQIQALTAEWNKLYFNQGAAVSGRYNPSTHAFLLTWRSQVKGGPFNGFTGVWHLQGKVR